MFLLVIFILLAARFEPEGGIPVDLPQASVKETAKVESINLSITAEGRFYLEQEEVERENLTQALLDLRTTLGDPEGRQIVLVVNGDREARHSWVVEALDAASRAHQQKVSIRTRE
jgi:biopolymer transport protein ExbD